MFLIPWYVTLCVAQGVLVVIPAVGRENTTRRNALLGIAGPAVAMVIGVGVVGLLGGAGASFLTWLGTIATPVLAGFLGWTARWRWPWLTGIAAAALYVIAWRADGRPSQIAAMFLVGGACLTIAGIVGPITPARYLAIGLVALVVLDTYLVFGTTQVASTTQSLQQTTLPHVGVVAQSRPLPGLQQVDLGNSSMGWLDFLAPALLGAVVGRRTRPRVLAAVVLTVTALAWGLLLEVTDELPATVPVLAGLAVTWREWRYRD
jgi:hypothetical protein